MFKKLIALIKQDPPKWSTPEVINSLNREKIGIELAKKVANKLKQGKQLYYAHPDYCGQGLMYKDDSYHIFRIIDADIEDALTIEKFHSPEEFINFLARQSDYSFAGADSNEAIFYSNNLFELNNQRLKKRRLEKFTKDTHA